MGCASAVALQYFSEVRLNAICVEHTCNWKVAARVQKAFSPSPGTPISVGASISTLILAPFLEYSYSAVSFVWLQYY